MERVSKSRTLLITRKVGEMAKIRMGLVSNSSSSSFIIATDSNKPELVLSISIEDIVDRIIKNKDELDEWFLDQYGFDTVKEMLEEEPDYCGKTYKKCITSLNLGKRIMIGCVSNEDDEPMSNFIYSNGFNGNVNFDIIREVE
jgi:hypothetical protein